MHCHDTIISGYSLILVGCMDCQHSMELQCQFGIESVELDECKLHMFQQCSFSVTAQVQAEWAICEHAWSPQGEHGKIWN